MAEGKNEPLELLARYNGILSGILSADRTYSTTKRNLKARKKAETESTKRCYADTVERLTEEADKQISRIIIEEEASIGSANARIASLSMCVSNVKHRLKQIKLDHLLSLGEGRGKEPVEDPASKMSFEAAIYRLEQQVPRSEWSAREIDEAVESYTQWLLKEEKIKRRLAVVVVVLLVILADYLMPISCAFVSWAVF